MTFENSLLSDTVELPDKSLLSTLPLERSEGRVEVRFIADGDMSRLAHLYQRGCARVRFPVIDRVEFPEAVLINTAGGLTGGDKVTYEITVEAGARLTVSGQAAEKIYRSVGPAAHIDTDMEIGPHAVLEWLPQETILFEKSRLHRINRVHLTDTSRFLAVEAIVFGREAHGESLRDVSVRDGWKIWRNGKLIWYDSFALSGDIQATLERTAILAGARSVATVVLADENIPEYLTAFRKVIDDNEIKAAASCRNGIMITRVFGENSYGLRRSLAIILSELRNKMTGEKVSLPRAWEIQ